MIGYTITILLFLAQDVIFSVNIIVLVAQQTSIDFLAHWESCYIKLDFDLNEITDIWFIISPWFIKDIYLNWLLVGKLYSQFWCRAVFIYEASHKRSVIIKVEKSTTSLCPKKGILCITNFLYF